MEMNILEVILLEKQILEKGGREAVNWKGSRWFQMLSSSMLDWGWSFLSISLENTKYTFKKNGKTWIGLIELENEWKMIRMTELLSKIALSQYWACF